MADKPDPSATSSDYDAMLPYWDMVDTIVEGADAMREAGETYLTRFPNETVADYDYRLANAKFTNIYADIVSNLAAKPFVEEVGLEGEPSAKVKALVEDIDGRGNNLHVFASQVFYDGINRAIDWILVEFTKAVPREDGQPLSLAEEKEQGLRPYWVHVPAKRMLAVYSDVVGGKEIFTHARISECSVSQSGFGEVMVERVRVLNREAIVDAKGRVTGYAPATFEVWEKREKTAGRRTTISWEVVDQGPITIGVIALVPFITGRRKGGSWQFVPALKDAAELQVKHYQAETALWSIKELTAFPMLAGNGVQPQMKDGVPVEVPVGPRAVLYAPPTGGDTSSHGEWTFIEPSAESLKFLAGEVATIEKQLRELGRQPLTADSGNLTVVTTAFAAQKGNSAVQAWAMNLKDALEQALALTALWLKETTAAEVKVYTDFDVGLNDEKGPATLTEARKNRDLSQRTYWEELQRRGILSGDFDPEQEEKLLEAEAPDEDDQANIDAAGGGGGQRAAA